MCGMFTTGNDFAIEHGPDGLSCNFSPWDVDDFLFESRTGRLNCERFPV